MNKKIIIIGFLIVIFIFLIMIFTILSSLAEKKSSKNNQPLTPVVTPTTLPEKPTSHFSTILLIPTASPSQGKGIDIGSTAVQESKDEISKLTESLPFSKDITSKDGVAVSIFIPQSSYFKNEWTMNVELTGIDYEVPKNSQDYAAQKQAFTEAMIHVINFLRAQQINPSKVIMSFGEKAYIQDRAEEWLSTIPF